jgi:extracellular elastinolytic metalloproteinase
MMSRELDLREVHADRATRERWEALSGAASQLSERLPGAQRVRVTSVDPVTGNADVVVAEATPALRGDYVERATEFLTQTSPVLGLTEQAAEFRAAGEEQETSTGAVAVHVQQLYGGIPVFQATETVRFAPDGALQDATGTSISVDGAPSATPRLSVEDAVLRAAEHVAVPDEDEHGSRDQFGQVIEPAAVDIAGFTPSIREGPTDTEQRTVLDGGPFEEPITAQLVWFPLDEQLRLAWEVFTTMPGYAARYQTLVDAETGAILYCAQLVAMVAARGNVFLVDGGGQRQWVEFPPDEFVDDWVDLNETAGNCTNAHEGDGGPATRGAEGDDWVVSFDPPAGTVEEQVVNAFYFCGVMHDYLYARDFREPDGNFQQSNFGRGGTGNDRVDTRVLPDAIQGTATMLTRPEGQSPVMRLGLFTNTGRHTALDSSVVYHEFTHGLTNRLVGGPQNASALQAPQSRGMGEGWSDYIACTVNDTTVVGAWLVDRPGGIRGFRYDGFPDDFGDLGTGRYAGQAPHPIGEIWCAALLEMNRRIGRDLGVQLVIDALKLTPANPSFLDGRDALLRALDNMRASGRLTASQHHTATRGFWRVFARFGMGPTARSDGAQLTGIVADFTMPPYLAVGHFGYNAGNWRVDRHPRFVADTTGDGRADIVGFGDVGVWVSRARPDGTFTAPKLVVGNLGYDAGGWRVERHPRFLADTTGDGRADIIGFGDAGVWVSRAQPNGTFAAPQLAIANFAYNAGNWRVDQHPRLLADTTGDGRADIIGFGDAGVWVSEW